MDKVGLIILDRDGTLIKHVHHLVDKSLVELIPGVGLNLRELSKLGFEFAIATNQSVIGRDLATEQIVKDVNKKIEDLLKVFEVSISLVYICPHLPQSECNCRKPKPSMGIAILEALGYSQNNSVMIGDNVTDIQFAANLGIPSIHFSEAGKFSDTATRNCGNWNEVSAAVIELMTQRK